MKSYQDFSWDQFCLHLCEELKSIQSYRIPKTTSTTFVRRLKDGYSFYGYVLVLVGKY